jgi:ATP-dependent DNA helicase RecG
MSAEKCLQHLDLATFDGKGLRLRRAALLLFSSTPTKWHPRLQVRILRVNGTTIKSGADYNVVTDEVAANNILRLIDISWEMLRPHLTETRFAGDALFRRQIIYPELACREALINAIAHRDYSIEGRGVEVRVFSDRLEVSSPGALLSTIDIADLRTQKGVHQSRNSFVARVLREGGHMRELGEGIRRIFELMRTSDLSEPTLQSSHDDFVITLRHQYVYTREQKLWLDNFSSLELTREQKAVVLLGYDGRVISPQEIWNAVGVVDTDAYRRLIESLDQLGILERVVQKDQATRFAQKQGVPRKRIGRFTIRTPSQHRSEVAPESRSSTTATPGTAAQSAVASAAGGGAAASYTRIFVANLPWSTTEDGLRSVFEHVGSVEDVRIPVDGITGASRGFGFVEFSSEESAEKAVLASGRLTLDDRKLFIAPAERQRSPR